MQTTQQDRRDQFAMAVMTGLCASWGQHDVTDYDELAKDAYKAADAMIAASATPAPSGKLEEAASRILSDTTAGLREMLAGMTGESAYPIVRHLEKCIASIEKRLATAHEASESALPEKSEVKELPEYWAIELTPENSQIVSEWSSAKWHTGQLPTKGFLHSDSWLKTYMSFGYTLIDDATFKAQVLKQPSNS